MYNKFQWSLRASPVCVAVSYWSPPGKSSRLEFRQFDFDGWAFMDRPFKRGERDCCHLREGHSTRAAVVDTQPASPTCFSFSASRFDIDSSRATHTHTLFPLSSDQILIDLVSCQNWKVQRNSCFSLLCSSLLFQLMRLARKCILRLPFSLLEEKGHSAVPWWNFRRLAKENCPTALYLSITRV